jgi:glycosyltransferase involved in cell wall biosynthesis
VEAQACGTPVIGYGRGGLLETVHEGKSGVLFLDPTPESLLEAWERFESTAFSEKEIRAGVLRFGIDRFAEEVSDWIEADGPPVALFSGELPAGSSSLTLVPTRTQ